MILQCLSFTTKAQQLPHSKAIGLHLPTDYLQFASMLLMLYKTLVALLAYLFIRDRDKSNSCLGFYTPIES